MTEENVANALLKQDSAIEFFNAGTPDKALELILEARKLDPTNLDILHTHGAFLNKTAPHESLAIFNEMITLSNGNLDMEANACISKVSLLLNGNLHYYPSDPNNYEELTKYFNAYKKDVVEVKRLLDYIPTIDLVEPEDLSVAIEAYNEMKALVDETSKLIHNMEYNKTVEDVFIENGSVTWKQAEDLVGKLFEKKGYDVTVGVPTLDGKIKRNGDFGIDVRARNDEHYLGIQVKHWNSNVDFDDVAKTLGVAQEYNKVIIVSTKSGFTPQALQHASNNSSLIELWDNTRFIQELKDHSLNIY
jgi:HJR/Mrr/RecB family endonuclease